MRCVPILVLAAAIGLTAATLERLSEEDLIRKSTEIVEGKVVASGSTMRGMLVYTTYRIQIKETMKGGVAGQIEVAVPGGRHGATIQTFAGSPTLAEGQNYLLFLWTSRGGLTQVIGLSQGLFRIKQSPNGDPYLYRAATTEAMYDSAGNPVEDTPVTMRYRDMVSRIRQVLEEGAK